MGVVHRGGSKPLDREKIIALMRQGYTVQRVREVTGWSYGAIRNHIVLHQIETDEDFGLVHKEGVTREDALRMRREIKELMDFNDPPLTICKIMELVGANRGFVSCAIKAWRMGELHDDGTTTRPVREYRRGQTKG